MLRCGLLGLFWFVGASATTTYVVTIPTTEAPQCPVFANFSAPFEFKCKASMQENFTDNSCWFAFYKERLSACNESLFKYGSKDYGWRIAVEAPLELEGMFENVHHNDDQFDETAHGTIFGDADISAARSLSRFAKNSEGATLPIQNWDVSRVTNLSQAFENSTFGEDLSSWNVSSVVTFFQTFKNNKAMTTNIGQWSIRNDSSVDEMLEGACWIDETMAQQTFCDLKARNQSNTNELLTSIRYAQPGVDATNNSCGGVVDSSYNCYVTTPGALPNDESDPAMPWWAWVLVSLGLLVMALLLVYTKLMRRKTDADTADNNLMTYSRA